MKKINLLLLIILLQVIFVYPAFAKDPSIEKMIITNLNEDVVVYYNLEGAFKKDIVEAIDNGIPTTFTFLIRLNKMNTLWFDSSVADIKIFREITYDSLKKMYIVTETVKGEAKKELKKTQDFKEAKKTMTEFKSVSLVSSTDLKKKDNYELRVKAELEKVKLPFYLEYVLVFVSVWDFETDWYIEEFTY
ncbi:DUF4390 domain-containing protein [Thermodesulfobacteriota bacterium]